MIILNIITISLSTRHKVSEKIITADRTRREIFVGTDFELTEERISYFSFIYFPAMAKKLFFYTYIIDHIILLV